MATKKSKKTKAVVKPPITPPDFIRIGYQDYKLDITPYSLETHGVHGTTNKVASIIQMNLIGNDVEQANTLIHETLHAIFHTQGILVDHDTEELVVNAMANGLTQVLRDNPEWIEFVLFKLGMLE